MRRVLFWLIGVPLALVLVAFAMANRHMVEVSFDPLRPGEPWMALSVPLWTVLFFGIFCGLLAGWTGAWLSQRKWRRAARGARSELAETRSEADRLRREQARLAAPAGREAPVQLVSADDLARLAPHGDVVEALREAFQKPYVTPLRHHHEIERGAAPAAVQLIMPAWTDMADGAEGGFVGLKTVLVMPDNPAKGLPTVQATYQLFAGDTGAPLAMLDGTELTLRRTACASALAASYLARPDAARLVMVGAGALAPHMVRAHAAVRPIRQVAVWSRTKAKAEALAASLAGEGFEATAPDDLEPAVRRADIVACATTSSQAIVRGRWLEPGVHVDLAGAFRPTMREVDGEAVGRAAVFVDTTEGALSEGGDLIQAIEEGWFKADDVRADLVQLTTGAHKGRSSAEEITLFKSCGTALEDLATAIMVYRGL